MTDETPIETPKAEEERRRNGFSLVELMVVIFIIGLLATVVLINVLPSQDKAMVVKARSDIATLEQGMEMYRLDMASYPGLSEGLSALKTPPANLSMPQNYRSGGYVKDVPTDPWGHPYQYQTPGRDGKPFEIFSLGADGQPGGSDLNADIYAGQN
ncbi:type II secretion system major pseudopilin GspG [Novosphingobium sp. SL115]|uniref:type II secretion system major pseudopilin GspG n=1 Tax=Novosphingobium sp. SL115 TaxID=2995150 RepID=UPI0022756A35|nr:type II secretion system major pseudopilin GspG [Novosphingobium sp. SL115]MCY1669705.1 type II secretion system major pseudopilin GspG [Novosphingobium sp. SL115]